MQILVSGLSYAIYQRASVNQAIRHTAHRKLALISRKLVTAGRSSFSSIRIVPEIREQDEQPPFAVA